MDHDTDSATREMLARELHHFEAEQAMTEALAALESHEPGENDYLERIYRAGNILRIALGWTQTAERDAPEGVVVQARDSGGHVQPLVREGGLWFFPDKSMYVYYVPTAWRHLDGSEQS